MSSIESRQSFSELFFFLFFSACFFSCDSLFAFIRTELASHIPADRTALTAHAQISVLAPQNLSITDKDRQLWGLHFAMKPGWHVYWLNPGDSGNYPLFTLEIDGHEITPASELIFPTPERLPIAHLMNFGYSGEVVYFFEFDLKTILDANPHLKIHNHNTPHKKHDVEDSFFKLLNVKANLEWLICEIECVPGFANFNFNIPIKVTINEPNIGRQAWAPEVLKTLETFKKRLPKKSNVMPATSLTNQSLVLEFENWSELSKHLENRALTEAIENLDLFFYQEAMPTQKPQFELISLSDVEAAHRLKATLPVSEQSLPEEISFVLKVGDQGFAFENIRLNTETPETSISFLTFLLLVFAGIAGGLILNLMPCVLPVLSIKFFSLINSKKSPSKESLSYTFGVLISFLFLGFIFLALRAMGSVVGWGFQLQSPIVIYSLILLFFVLALSFLDVFELSDWMNQKLGKFQNSGSFWTGVLAVFVATPCTGPFMGAVLGATAFMPAMQSLLLFMSLGVGLALPFLILGFVPGLAKKLPKPGTWMIRLKEFLAFPLLATAIWLIWVLSLQAGSLAVALALIACLAVSFGLWLTSASKKRGLWIGSAIIIITILVCGWTLHRSQRLNHSAVSKNSAGGKIDQNQNSNPWIPFSPEKLLELQQSGAAVFIDFTAAWCITCQINKQVVLDTLAAQDLFRQNQVTLMRADWTKQDPIIGATLAKYGRNSVPLYLYFPPNSELPGSRRTKSRGDSSKSKDYPKILPQILTFEILRSAIETSSN